MEHYLKFKLYRSIASVFTYKGSKNYYFKLSIKRIIFIFHGIPDSVWTKGIANIKDLEFTVKGNENICIWLTHCKNDGAIPLKPFVIGLKSLYCFCILQTSFLANSSLHWVLWWRSWIGVSLRVTLGHYR